MHRAYCDHHVKFYLFDLFSFQIFNGYNKLQGIGVPQMAHSKVSYSEDGYSQTSIKQVSFH